MYFWCLMREMIPATLLPSYSVPGGWGYSGMFWVGMCCLGVQIWTLCYKKSTQNDTKTYDNKFLKFHAFCQAISLGIK